MFRKPNDVFPPNKPSAAAHLARHWKLVFWRLFWFVLSVLLFGCGLDLLVKQTKPYQTQDLHLLGRALRLEIKKDMTRNEDTEQQNGNDDKEIGEKAENIGKISQELLKQLNATWYFVCIAHYGKLLTTVSGNLSPTAPRGPARSSSANHFCDEGTIKEYHKSPPGDPQKKSYVVKARESEGLEIPPTIHFVNDGDGSDFHLWVVRRLQPEQAYPIYSLVKNYFLHVMLILIIIAFFTYALGRFICQESRSNSDSGRERVV